MAVRLYLSMSSKRVMAAALLHGKTCRMFFIRHRQCSVYSLKLSDSCLSWTQERPSVKAHRETFLAQPKTFMGVSEELMRGWRFLLFSFIPA